jgi:hypothetical protein
MSQVAHDALMAYPVQAALVEASGKLFWYWRAYEHCLRRAGVHPATIARLRAQGLSKYELMRELLAELDDAGANGRRVEHQLVIAFATHPLNTSADIDVPAAQAAQRELQRVARQFGVMTDPAVATHRAEERRDARARHERRERQRRTRERLAARRKALLAEYIDLSQAESNRQGRGYRLETMLGELATLEGVPYHQPFRKGTATQTDGMVTYDGFQYLIEARWRSDPATVDAIGSLSAKALRNMQSTRGLFLSITGFRPPVVREIETGTKNVLLMTGQELALILEGRFSFTEALRRKVDACASRGVVLLDLAQG